MILSPWGGVRGPSAVAPVGLDVASCISLWHGLAQPDSMVLADSCAVGWWCGCISTLPGVPGPATAACLPFPAQTHKMNREILPLIPWDSWLIRLMGTRVSLLEHSSHSGTTLKALCWHTCLRMPELGILGAVELAVAWKAPQLFWLIFQKLHDPPTVSPCPWPLWGFSGVPKALA